MSAYSQIPVMYHPTNVFLLDDDQKFLTDVSLILQETIPYVVDDDPVKILNYLRSHTYQRDALSSLLTKQVFDGGDHIERSVSETFVIDFSRLQQNLASPDRFKMSTVGMIDRMMKKIDGLEFCRDLRSESLLIKTVLFTGQTKADEAIKAFNGKAIDGYLVKQGMPRQLVKEINTTIMEQSWQLFVELSEALTGLLSHVLKPLSDEIFVNIFDSVRNSNKTVEFYLLDSSCSFLLLDADGQAKQFFVRSDIDFNDCYEIAKDSKAPYDVLQNIRSRQMFPYTIRPMDYAKLEGDQWDSAMVQMDKVPGRDLYYTVVDRSGVEVFSFDRYLREEWPRP